MRYYYHRKATAEESCDITIFQLKKWGMLAGSTNRVVEWFSRNTGKKTARVVVVTEMEDEPLVMLLYSLTDRYGNETKYDQIVQLTTTPCNFGGERYWFLCPLCYSRVGALYLPRNDVRFACRHCNDITYQSRNRCTMGLFGHTSRQIDKLRSEIKRWTWQGRPTRKVRRLQALERKMGVLSGSVMTQVGNLRVRLRGHR
jgi:hypothetical protein